MKQDFRIYSEQEEDGILLYLFSCIGMTSRQCVDCCVGNVYAANTTNLILHHGFDGVLLEGDEITANKARQFYLQHPATYLYPPRVVHAWVTRENINQLIAERGLRGEIDLLSLDMDGVDYWIWDALEVVNPRVVVVEIQLKLGTREPLTVPYKPDFTYTDYPYIEEPMMVFGGASLSAFVQLGRRKGYRLVGAIRKGYNAFFLRNDICPSWFPEVTIESCLRHPLVQQRIAIANQELPNLPYVRV